MAQVTYRGVRYETGTKDKKDPQAKTLTYRGHAYSVEVSKMLVVSEIMLASVVFLGIIYVETRLLYNYK